MNTITIHQPDFLPWLGFFDRWRKSDIYVVLDDVQFLRRAWQHRDRIKTAAGASWLTIPVVKKGQYDQRINETCIDNSQGWRRKHLRRIREAYAKAPHFEEIMSGLEAIYAREHDMLMEFNLDLLYWCAELFGIAVPVRMASEFQVSSVKTERLVDLMTALEGTDYLTGYGSKAYLDEKLFAGRGMAVHWHDFEHPVYGQLHGEFIPKLSSLDYLMNEGPGDIPDGMCAANNETDRHKAGRTRGNASC